MSPIGDAALGSGVTFPAGVTDAPDVVSIGNFRPSIATTTATLVDFTFDEPASVANRTAGQFQLIQPDGGEFDGTPVNNATTVTDTTDVQGDGTTTITVSFPNEDGSSVAPITAANAVRGVVLEGTVSDEDQVANVPETVEGNVNPLQVTDAGNGGTTTVPDLVSATINQDNSTVTYVFDEDVVVVDAELFRVYDGTGEETAGSTASSPNSTTVVVAFDGDALDDVTGASADEGAVRESGTSTVVNQEDEVGAASPAVAARSTTGPDLTDVTREVDTESRTDPFTGETTITTTGVTIRFIFDDEASIPSSTFGSGSFFVVNATGARTELTGCDEANDTTVEGDENVIVCDVPQDSDPVQPGNQGTEEFEAARDAVLATVERRAVEDDEGTDNPEGAEVIAGA